MKRSARLRLGRSRTSRCHDIFLLCWPSSLRLLSSTLHPSPFCSVTGRAVWVHPRSPQPSGPQLDAADGRHRLEAGGWRLAGEEARVLPSSLSRWRVPQEEAQAPAGRFSPRPLRCALMAPPVATRVGGEGFTSPCSYFCKQCLC